MLAALRRCQLPPANGDLLVIAQQRCHHLLTCSDDYRGKMLGKDPAGLKAEYDKALRLSHSSCGAALTSLRSHCQCLAALPLNVCGSNLLAATCY